MLDTIFLIIGFIGAGAFAFCSPKKSITKSWNDGKSAELKDRVNI